MTWLASASLYPVSPPDNTFALPTEVVPRYRLSSYGRRAFAVAGPAIWNWLPLPDSMRDPGHQQRLLQTFTEDVFIFSLLVYIAH